MAAFDCAKCGTFTENEGIGFFRQADAKLLCTSCAYRDPTLAWEFGTRHGFGEGSPTRHRFPTVTADYDAGVDAGQRERHHQEARAAAAEDEGWLADQARDAESARVRRERDRLLRRARPIRRLPGSAD